MRTDRRGFRYPLEPVLKLVSWELDDRAQDYARQSVALDRQQRAVAALQASLSAVASAVLTAQVPGTRIDVSEHQRSFLYMRQLEQSLDSQHSVLATAQRAHDAAHAMLLESRKLSSSLMRSRQAAALEHDADQARLGYVEADDSWQQRRYWKGQR